MRYKSGFVTKNSVETRKLGEMLAKELRGGEIICLSGELGSGKTTYAQGILKGLGVKGPFTSPTFVVMKHYRITRNATRDTRKDKKILRAASCELRDVYHIDAYRVEAKDILDLGWKEITAGKKNLVVVEWAERIKRIIPKRAVWIEFEYSGKDSRKIIFRSQ